MKIPNRVSVYHGTRKKCISGIKREGMKKFYVTTSPFAAHYFANDNIEEDDAPVLLKIKVPMDKLNWADTYGCVTERASIEDIEDEDNSVNRRNGEYLFVDDFVKPKNIRVLSHEEMIRKVKKKEMKDLGMI